MTMTLMEMLSAQEQRAEQLNSANHRESVLDSARLCIDQSMALSDIALERLDEAQEAINTVRQQRDAALDLVKRYEHERFAYRVQGYAIGVILGVLITYGVMS